LNLQGETFTETTNTSSYNKWNRYSDLIEKRILRLEERLDIIEEKFKNKKEKKEIRIIKEKIYKKNKNTKKKNEKKYMNKEIDEKLGIQITNARIKIKFTVGQETIETEALIDTGCTNNIIDKKIIPKHWIINLPQNTCVKAEQMDGKLHEYCEILKEH